jgi:hypothetical protein
MIKLRFEFGQRINKKVNWFNFWYHLRETGKKYDEAEEKSA